MKAQHHKSFLAVLLIAGVGVMPLANAGHREVRPVYDGVRYDTAQVVDVEPIVRQVTVSTPERECWEEQVTYSRPYREHKNVAGNMILGGILGGVIGSRFGGGHGRDIATVAGTLIGASVAHDAANRRAAAHSRPETVTEHTCRVNHVRTVEERIDAYRVTYRYQGETYVTRMPYDPGDSLRVRVDVRPLSKRRF